MNDDNLKQDKVRKFIWSLGLEREKLLKSLMSPPKMIKGCIHTICKKCGNPNCHCKDGDKHGPYTAIVRKVGGVSKLTYVDKSDVIGKAQAYKAYNKRLASLRKINEKIFSYLRYLRDINTTAYEK